MATINLIHNPVFKELAVIQAGIDKFPNPDDNLDFNRCRALISGGSRRCKKPGGSKEKRQRLKELISEFRSMTECPDTDGFYENMEFFICQTHCSSHSNAVLKAFHEWKQRRTITASSSLPADPSPSIPSSVSPFSSSGETFSTSMSELSETISQVSLVGRLNYAESVSDCESEDVLEYGARDVLKETISNSTSTQNVDAGIDTTKSGPRTREKIPGLGDTIALRRRSVRNHSSVFQVLMEHPIEQIMQEGTVYILQHEKIPDLFNIGSTTIGAELELGRSNSCYRADAKVRYESKEKFRGSRQAEKIIHTWLYHQNIVIQNCEKCGKGHRGWFKGSEKVVFETVTNIETFVRMPAYVEENGEWKLSAEAYEIIKPMCHFEPSVLSKHERAVQKVSKEAGTSLGVIAEIMPPKVPQEVDEFAAQEIGREDEVPMEVVSEIVALENLQDTDKRGKLKGRRLKENVNKVKAFFWDSMSRWRPKPIALPRETTPEVDGKA